MQTITTPPEGKTVLITGAGSRLGSEIARAYARAGWAVVCHFNSSGAPVTRLVEEVRAGGGWAIGVQANLADDTGCQQLIATTQASVRHLDCLVNNASTFEDDAASSYTHEQMAHQLQVNLMAPLALAKGMAAELVRPGSAEPGCVIHILDQKVLNLNPDYFSYTVSKLALERAVALQAQALAPRLRVCGVAPGLMFLSGPQQPENFERASRINLMQRPLDAAQVAASCVFLASNPCITGITLAVDNGQHLVPLARDVMFVVDELFKKP